MKLIHLFLLLVLFISISCNKSDDQVKPLLDSGETQTINEIHKEDITFVSDGVTLAGRIYKPKNPHAGVVVVHGSDRVPRMTKFSEILASHGISVLQDTIHKQQKPSE